MEHMDCIKNINTTDKHKAVLKGVNDWKLIGTNDEEIAKAREIGYQRYYGDSQYMFLYFI
jgi:hypothetical protein